MKPWRRRKSTSCLPVGLGNLATSKLVEVEVEFLHDAPRAQPRQRLLESGGLDERPQSFLQIGDRLFFGFALAIRRDVRDAGGAPPWSSSGMSSTSTDMESPDLATSQPTLRLSELSRASAIDLEGTDKTWSTTGGCYVAIGFVPRL